MLGRKLHSVTFKTGWTGKTSFALEVPQRYLRPSIIYCVPCDRIVFARILLRSVRPATTSANNSRHGPRARLV